MTFSVTVPFIIPISLDVFPEAPYNPFIFAKEATYHGDNFYQPGRALEIHLKNEIPTSKAASGLRVDLGDSGASGESGENGSIGEAGPAWLYPNFLICPRPVVIVTQKGDGQCVNQSTINQRKRCPKLHSNAQKHRNSHLLWKTNI